MVATRKMRAQKPVSVKLPTRRGGGGGKVNRPPPAKKGFNYEKSREERIKENLQRMEKLGILNLSLKLNTHPPPKPLTPKIRKPQRKTSAQASRRSSRLTTKEVEDVEIVKKEDSEDLKVLEDAEDWEPEVYTEECVKLLGDCKTSWTLHVDRFDEDGKHILEGNKCHQCRLKTPGRLTECSKCKLVQGQLCGDCLYMRYGENIIEAKENKDLVCLACRSICNCSSCRRAKGWRPTGAIYRKVVGLGSSLWHTTLLKLGDHMQTKRKKLVQVLFIGLNQFLNCLNLIREKLRNRK